MLWSWQAKGQWLHILRLHLVTGSAMDCIDVVLKFRVSEVSEIRRGPPNVWNYPNNAFRGLSRWDKGFWFRVLGLGFGRPYFSAIVTRNLDELKLHQASPAYILLGSEFRLP